MNQFENDFKRSGIFAWVCLVMLFLTLFLVLRLVLLFNNLPALSMDEFSEGEFVQLAQAMLMGARFDLRMAMYACFPLVLLTVFRHQILNTLLRVWVLFFASTFLFFGLIEMEFYREFQQRLNSLVFQYLSEDYKTVVSMIWQGTPVLKYLIVYLLGMAIIWRFILFALPNPKSNASQLRASNILVVFVLVVTSILGARGTLRSGPPLRWGDAYQSEHMFLNHLALNGSYTLSKAAMKALSAQEVSQAHMIETKIAISTTRSLLKTQHETFINDGRSPIKRVAQKIDKAETEPKTSGPKNVVIVLMESFSGRYVGALGNDYNVTPEFDSLSKEGILFSRFFSNGTHTHQGVFATLACFPNLPNHEYLMQQPEGRNQFSGITKLLPEHNSLFVYNGDFNWDNQLGFFKNQGLQHFVGKHEIKAQQYANNVWGVPDHIMFDRAEDELLKLSQGGPFIAVVQSLSNHMPYELPQTLEFEPVMIDGEISERLTAMKYSDWSLGRFFRNIRNAPYYEDTLFVVLGDHGFAVPNQLTSINLLRFHVPLLFLGDFTEDEIGSINTTVASQVDVVPTIVSLLNETPVNQCWGRNLFDLNQEDEGFAVIKPSGGEPTMAIIKGESILTYDTEQGPNLYQYSLGNKSYAKKLENPDLTAKLKHELLSYVQTATTSLKNNSTSN